MSPVNLLKLTASSSFSTVSSLVAPSILGTITSNTSAVKYFEIRLDENPLVLRGAPYSASGVLLKGTVVLCLAEPLRIQGLRLRFTGERRLDFVQASGSNRIEDRFLRKAWDFERGGQTLPADNHVWPFEWALPGTTPESIEGLPRSWNIYRLKATIERGIMQQNVVARKHVRIIRTLDPSDLELSLGMSVANVWKDKIDYSIETPSKAAVFGTFVTVNFKLISLLKCLNIEAVHTAVKESQELRHAEGDGKLSRWKALPRVIAEDHYRVSENTETREVLNAHGCPQEGYEFARDLEIPKSLRDCMQSVEAYGFKIKHTLEFHVSLRNPDGHVSEVIATLPLQIFLSPLLAFDDNNNMTTQNSRAIDAGSLSAMAPPGYGEHRLDQLYNDIDSSGFQTPVGLATPLGAISRNESTDNLAFMNDTAFDNLAANTLRNRLDGLNSSGFSPGGNGPLYQNQTATDTSRRSPKQCLSRQSSGDMHTLPSGVLTPMQPSMSHVEYCADDLARVPSYSTALQSRPNIPIDRALPNYHAAIRTPIPTPPLRRPLP